MKINEIINESAEADNNNDGIPDSHQAATPGMRKHANLDNSSPYHPWRFAAHFLGGADGKNAYEHEPNRDGPNGQSLVTVAYTKEEQDMIDQAERAFGHEARHVDLTTDGSKETPETNRTSPMQGRGPIQLKSKKK